MSELGSQEGLVCLACLSGLKCGVLRLVVNDNDFRWL